MTVGPVTRDAATAGFFDGTAAGQFLLRHCRTCGSLSAPQAVQCENCSSTELDWRPASANATLITWTIAHSKPDASGETHRTILGIAELAEGPWWWSQIVDADPAELRAGAPLRISFQRHDDQAEAVPVFSLAGLPTTTERELHQVGPTSQGCGLHEAGTRLPRCAGEPGGG
jgi:uncharacterized OB-fold protein